MSVKLTQRMTLHLNGGSSFSQTNYAILADGQPTGVTLIERTDGSPHYYYTSRRLVRGNEELDLMAAAGPDPVAWITERIGRATENPDEGEGT